MNERNNKDIADISATDPIKQGKQTTTALAVRESPFHPRENVTPNLDYARFDDDWERFMTLRRRLLDEIRKEKTCKTHDRNQIIGDIIDSLMSEDPDISSGLLFITKTIFTFGRTYRKIIKKRELFSNVVTSLLEKTFDLELRFKMTKDDILDTFVAHGSDRDKARKHVETIYSKVLEKLQAGAIRDIIYDEQLLAYARLKIEEILLSRQDSRANP